MKTWVVAAVVLASLAAVGQGATKFRIAHLNDFHARVEGIEGGGRGCRNITDNAADLCDGGWPRVFTAAREYVANSTEPVIFVDAGDQFLGTVWSNYYKGVEASTFLNRLCDPVDGVGFYACVGTLGNHEWDYKYETLLKNYTSQIQFDLISTNTVDNCAENSQGTHAAGELGTTLKKSTIVTLPDSTKVGFVAYTTPETMQISSPPSCIVIQDEATALNVEITTSLTTAGVDIIIALGHSGYNVDQQLMQTVTELDFVVGGHSHTHTWDESTQGANPAISADFFGQITPLTPIDATIDVQHAYWGGRFFGMLELEFDNSGDLTNFTRESVLLGSSTALSLAVPKYQFDEDPEIVALIQQLKAPLNAFLSVVVGVCDAFYSYDEIRLAEQPLGNMICDSFMHSITPFVADVDFCMTNSGGIRISLGAGEVELGEVIDILPFGNVLSVVEMTGAQIYLMLEHSVSRVGAKKGEFAHFSEQFQYFYNSREQPACGACSGCIPCTSTNNVTVNRVLEAYINGVLVSNDDSQTFKVVTNDYIKDGGDSYQVMKETNVIFDTGAPADQAFSDFIAAETAANGFISAQRSCRIIDVAENFQNCALPSSVTFAPSAAPSAAPTASPTIKINEDTNQTSVIAGAVAGGLIAVALLAAFFFCKPANETSSAQTTKAEKQQQISPASQV